MNEHLVISHLVAHHHEQLQGRSGRRQRLDDRHRAHPIRAVVHLLVPDRMRPISRR